MAPIEALQSFNPFLQQAQGVNPFKVQGPKVTQPQEPKTTETKEPGLQGELAYIRNNGMRVNDQNFAVNEPYATTGQKQLGKQGVTGGTLRILG